MEQSRSSIKLGWFRARPIRGVIQCYLYTLSSDRIWSHRNDEFLYPKGTHTGDLDRVTFRERRGFNGDLLRTHRLRISVNKVFLCRRACSDADSRAILIVVPAIDVPSPIRP